MTGPSGSGKSDLVLRLLARGFTLVADDQVVLQDGVASAPPSLVGLLEVRGLGIVRLPHLPNARVALVVRLGPDADRMPQPEQDPELGVPTIQLDPFRVSSAERVALALDCALGRTAQVAGAFAA